MSIERAPITEAEILAARVRAAEGGVPWDRAKAISEAMRKAAVKREARRRRRNKIIAASAATLLLLMLVLAWLLTRRG